MMQTGTNIVISQVYGGGGNAGAPYLNDYVELFNPSNTPIPVNGWSIQYTSPTGTGLFSSNVVNLSGSLSPGQYYLIRLASGGSNGAALPPSDATGTIDMGAYEYNSNSDPMGCT
ncbi:MAG: lamin tail domain-containing protein, partial [Anaerolineales bacterium]|nr:lamin tail domain-containing protein [Anaerolineales bacterium]